MLAHSLLLGQSAQQAVGPAHGRMLLMAGLLAIV